MAGDSRIQGAGPRLSLLDGDLARVLQELRFRGSSIRSVVFQSPGATAGRKIVTNECSPDTPYEVVGDVNFRPGTPVLVGSFAGSGEETIIARAPADKAGAASNPVRLSRGTLRRPQPVPPVLPEPSLLAVSILFPFSSFKAWLALEGEPLEELAEGPLDGVAHGVNPGSTAHRAPTAGHAIVYNATGTVAKKIVSLDCVSGASFVFQIDSTGVFDNIAISDGEYAYFRAARTSTLFAQSAQLYRVPILENGATASGLFDTVMPPIAWGPLFPQDATFNIGSSLAWMGGSTFQIPCTVSGVRKILRLEGGAWTLDSRTTLGNSNGSGNQNGYPLGGGIAVFKGLTSTPSNRPLLIDLVGPMQEALPAADWPAYSSHLTGNFSVAPDGSRLSYYNPTTGEQLILPVDSGGLVAELGAGSPIVATIAPAAGTSATLGFAL